MFRISGISGDCSCQGPGPEHELQRQCDRGTEKILAEVFALDLVGLPIFLQPVDQPPRPGDGAARPLL